MTGSTGRRHQVPHTGGPPRAEQVQRLLDQLPALIAYWDKDLRNEVANAAYVEYFGRSPEEMRGMHISEVLGPQVFRSNEPYLRAALEGEEQHFQRTLVDTTGRVHHTQASYVPDVVDGQVRGIFVLVSDVTPRVEAERELDEAQELAGLGSWSMRPGSGLVTWSRQMYRLVGQDPAVFTPSHEAYRRFIHPDDIERVRRVQAEKLWSGEDFDLRYRLVVDGQVRSVASRTRPVVGDDGQPLLLRGTVQDESEVQRQATALESTNRLLSTMVGMVGHDVRQPVSVILGNLEQAIDTWPADVLPEQRRMTEQALAASGRLGELLQDVLAMVSIDTGDLLVRGEAVEVADLVREVVANVAKGDVGVMAEAGVRAQVDPFHLRQALTNLLANAHSYGGAPVSVEAAEVDGRVTITVADEGEGVPPDFVPHLFDRFTRAPSGVAALRPGSGFGLFIVKELIGANSGTVGFAPNSPSGARFTLTVPAAT
ncbi:MAG: PAS domain-containing protein [Marmoricola sp.]